MGLILIGACLGALIPMTLTILAQGRLRVLSGPRSGLEVDVLDAVTLGSYDGCTLYLPGDKAIARKHARVYRQDRRFFVTDLDSPGGTKVNGTPLAPGASSLYRKRRQDPARPGRRRAGVVAHALYQPQLCRMPRLPYDPKQ